MTTALNPLPQFEWLEDDRHLKHPHSFQLAAQYSFIYRRGPWRSIGACRRVVLRQLITGWIIANGIHIGRVELALYRFDRSKSNSDFCIIMDDEDGYEGELAYALSNAWSDVRNQVAIFAPILSITLVWLDRDHRRKGVTEQLLEALTTNVATDYSVLVLKAYPHDEGLTPVTPDPAKNLEALMQHYGRIFGVAALPGSAGQEGWMWAPHPRFADLILPPLVSE